MNRYNIALIPSQEETQEKLQQLAKSHFADLQDGYLLGDEALAHVTLCQFQAESQEQARNVFLALEVGIDYPLAIKDFHFRKGEEKHEGYVWAEFVIQKSPSLMALQEKCHKHVLEMKCKPLTAVDDYSPHITLARLKNATSQTLLAKTPTAPFKEADFEPAIGITADNGELLEEI